MVVDMLLAASRNVSNISQTIETESRFETTLGNNTLNTTSAPGTDADNGITILAISVPIAVLALIGIVIIILLILRRKTLKHKRQENQTKGKSKPSHDSGVTNEAFDGHMSISNNMPFVKNGFAIQDAGTKTTTSDRESKLKVVDEIKTDLRLKYLYEDDFGYGQYQTKTNDTQEEDAVYQNTFGATGDMKQATPDIIYSNLGDSTCNIYSNVEQMPVASDEMSEKNARPVCAKKLDESDDPLYDHTNTHICASKAIDTGEYYHTQNDFGTGNGDTSPDIYENTSVMCSKDQNPIPMKLEDDYSNSQQSTTSIPFYLDIEDDENELKRDNDTKAEDIGEMLTYDYATVNRNTNVSSEAYTNKHLEGTEDKFENDTPDRFYFILEKENVVVDENDESESDCSNHEYFTLEKLT